MSDDTQQPIVVKRIKKGGGGHHGGAWKIAYADFVTAMMAFFLLMWLLGSTAKGDLVGIADYFQNPLKLAMDGGEGSGDSSSIIKGGGEDLTRSLGQVKRGDFEGRRTINLDAARGRETPTAEVPAEETETRRERVRLLDLKGRIEAIIEADPLLRQFKNQILMDITTEGLRIQLVDEQNRPMFNTASADLRPYTRDLLRDIGRALNDVNHRISLSGHTDSAQYAGGDRGFSNWELSSNRANAARRELIVGGLEMGKVVRVVGLADTIPLNKENLLDPMNRRISIVVLNKRTEESLRTEGGQVEVNSGAPVDGGALRQNIEQQAPAPAGPLGNGARTSRLDPPLGGMR
ncbi:flagellar motor protein MotB [Azoarcus indigens]|uniref:Chemotaxis protein MotB n=1 Tax=Azoarcus indigens TaxID=29545 RepID=A0A4R6EDB1_9RHOO|nr:flagellar motor protein MotB [Azoarcus indigens]NMG63652.1 flagellar motor protein MotB [Azoarcus indigens]TDN56186.1 chemotaxis protein MotB [Azoarcus indigens]